MDVLVLLWSASVFAAISFFAAGLATHAAVVRRRPAPVVGDDSHARAREHAAQARIAELETGLARVNDDAARVRAALVGAERNATAADGRAATAEQRASTFEQRAAAAEQRATVAEQRATTAEQRATTAEQRATTAEQRATTAERRAITAEQRATTADGALATATARIAALDAELVAKTPVRKPLPVRARPPSAANRQDDTVEGSLAARLGTFADECGYEVVVLSDAQGLLLAGVGDNEVQGTIAALSSVARELTTRAAEFVELRPKLIEVTDDAGRTLRIRLFQWEQEPIALASFGVGQIEPTQEEETVITVFPTLMAAS